MLLAVARADEALEALTHALRTAIEQNVQALRAELTQLDKAYASTLTSCDRSVFLTTHAAFGYLATRYRLTQIEQGETLSEHSQTFAEPGTFDYFCEFHANMKGTIIVQ